MATPEAVMAPSFDQQFFEGGIASQESNRGEVLQAQTPSPIRSQQELPLVHDRKAASARPNLIRFGALNDPEYKLRDSIPLKVETEDNHVIVNWGEIDEYGVGESLSEAITDFARSLRSLYRSLHATEALGPDLLKVRSVMDLYIEARPR